MPSLPSGSVQTIQKHERIFNRTRVLTLAVLCIFLALTLVVLWVTRGAMSTLPFSEQAKAGSAPQASDSLVDLSPWQTAQALAALAVTAEEKDYARDAERLADHSVDQAFAAALREANLRAEHVTPTGSASDLAQKVQQLQQFVAQDQAVIDQLTASKGAPRPHSVAPAVSLDTQLSIAKAQLQLDSDELADLSQDLGRAEGDERTEIKSELAAHEASMKKYDSEADGSGQPAILSVGHYGTLAGRLAALNRQRSRQQLIQQAEQQAESLAQKLTATHNSLQATLASRSAPGNGIAEDPSARLARLQDTSARRQLLSIYDDRIDTEQRLATVYKKWYQQVETQHRIVLHLIMQSLAWIAVILLCLVLGDALLRRVMEYPMLDARIQHTLRSVLELTIHIVGFGCILLIIFGAPQQTTTLVGLGTAALTIALQDFIVAFLGWFVLIGRKGIRVGDLVEIDGVGGQVTEIGLMTTTLLETGALSDRGYPTGRRITMMNGYAIRGKYFNFSTAGQWMWDQFEVAIPASENTHLVVERVLQVVTEETAENARLAEEESSRGEKGTGLGRFSAPPAVNLRPTAHDFELEVRYVTRASERAETRNRLYGRVIEVLHETHESSASEGAVQDAAR